MLRNYSIPNGQYPPTYPPTDLSPGTQKSAVTPPLISGASILKEEGIGNSCDEGHMDSGAGLLLMIWLSCDYDMFV
jgi:hypothetical protein